MEPFEATLTAGERHFSHRLESFGDVVFGFTISQLALQFELPHAPTDLLANPVKYVVYFATFALIALLWVRYHRLLSGGFFKPGFTDVALAFVYLAFTGLVPYAMNANIRFLLVASSAAYGLGIYLVCAIGTQFATAWLARRNYLRARPFITPEADLEMHRRSSATAMICALFAVQLAVDIKYGVAIASIGFYLIPLVRLIARRRIPGIAAGEAP